MASKHKRRVAPKIVVKPRRKAKIAKPAAPAKPNAQAAPAVFASMPTMPNGGVPPSFPHNS